MILPSASIPSPSTFIIYAPFPIIDPHQKPLKESNQFIHTIKHRNMHQCHHLFCNFFCRYKFWLTNGEPWDFFHYHFSADEFYILPILMVSRTHDVIKDDSNSSFLTKGDKRFFLTHWTGLWSLQSDPTDTYLQKCDPG